MQLDSMLDRKADVILLDRSFLSDLERRYLWAIKVQEAAKGSYPVVTSGIENEHDNPSHPPLTELVGTHDVDTYRPMDAEKDALHRHHGRGFFYGSFPVDSILSEADTELAALALYFARHSIKTSVASADKAIVSALSYEAREKEIPLTVYSPWTMPQSAKEPLIMTVEAKKELRKDGYILAAKLPDNDHMHEIAFMGSHNPVEDENVRAIPSFPSEEFLSLIGPYHVRHTKSGTKNEVPVINPWQLRDLNPETAATLRDMKNSLAFDAAPKGLYGRFYFT